AFQTEHGLRGGSPVQPPDQIRQTASSRLIAAAVAVTTKAAHQERPLIDELTPNHCLRERQTFFGVGETAELRLAQTDILTLCRRERANKSAMACQIRYRNLILHQRLQRLCRNLHVAEHDQLPDSVHRHARYLLAVLAHHQML